MNYGIEICYGDNYYLDWVDPIKKLYLDESMVDIPEIGLYKEPLEYIGVQNDYGFYEYHSINGYRIYDVDDIWDISANNSGLYRA